MKNIITSSILVLALLLPALATAHDFEVDSIYYNINGNEATVTFRTYDHSYYPFSGGYSGSVVIPATVTYNGITYPVTSIGDQAFYNCRGLTSVDIPNSVTSIGRVVFYNCTGLTSIVIPNSVTAIGVQAFEDCTGLTSIDIPNSVTAIGGYAFNNTAWYNNQPDGMVYAGKVAYKYKGTMPSGTNMTFKEGTLGIAGYAFEGCIGMTGIVIPNSVTEINGMAFFDCPVLTSIVVESGNPRYDSRNNCNAIIETASNTLFLGCDNTIFPNSITAIGDGAFSGCTGLTSIDIPNSVTSIGDDAFADCTGLTSFNIPNSLTYVGGYAFDNTAWYNNQPDGMVYVGMFAYGYKGTMPSGTNMTFKEGTLGIAGGAFHSCTGLASIVIPNSVTYIGDYALYYCTGLTSIDIPNSVTSIGDEAFSWCSGLTDVYCYIADLSSVSGGYEQFGDYYGSGRTLHVLQGTADAYRANKNWYPYFVQIVEDIFIGDVNRDLEVNIADVNAAISIILGGNDDTIAADVNGDGEINIADINALIDIILSGSWH